MVAFVFQALLGSVAMQTEQADIATRLASVEIPEYPGSSSSEPLFRSTQLTGWPESLNHTCTLAWAFLLQLHENWPWLNEIFGDAEHFRSALCAYYSLLNVIEFADAIKRSVDMSSPQVVHLSVPVSFTVVGETVTRRARMILESNRKSFSEIWQDIPGTSEDKLHQWKSWEAVMGSWIGQVYRGRAWRYTPFHSPFVKSL